MSEPKSMDEIETLWRNELAQHDSEGAWAAGFNAAIGISRAELRLRDSKLNHIIPWARRIRCILKTRELLERYENQFAPGYRTPPLPSATVVTLYNYHYDKWMFILNQNPVNDSRVDSLKHQLWRNYIHLQQFAAIMSDLYATTSKCIHFPSEVGDVSVQEIIQVFETEFQFIDRIQKTSLEILVSGL